MRYALLGMLGVVICLGFTGCAGIVAPVIPPTAMVLTNVKAPLSTEFNNTSLGTKTGSSESMAVLWLVAFGDCSIETAAKNGGLKTVNHADYEVMTVLFGMFSRFQVIVHGD